MEETSGGEPPMYVLMQKLRSVKKREILGNVTHRVEIGKKELDEIQNLLQTDPLNVELIQIEREAVKNQVA